MSIFENHSLGSQPVHVRRLGLRVALKRVRPVIQIIDGDEQYIRFSVLVGSVLSFDVLGGRAK